MIHFLNNNTKLTNNKSKIFIKYVIMLRLFIYFKQNILIFDSYFISYLTKTSKN